MRVKYLLPCQCGKQIPVDTRQAGQDVRCDCGTMLEVPTMRGVTALRRVDVEEEVDELSQTEMSDGWGVSQGVAVMGGVIFLLGVGLFVLHCLAAPGPVEFMTENLDSLTPADTFGLWLRLREGLPRDHMIEEHYLPFVAANKRWQYAGLGIAVIGALTLGGALLVLRRQRTESRSSAGREPPGG